MQVVYIKASGRKGQKFVFSGWVVNKDVKYNKAGMSNSKH